MSTAMGCLCTVWPLSDFISVFFCCGPSGLGRAARRARIQADIEEFKDVKATLERMIVLQYHHPSHFMLMMYQSKMSSPWDQQVPLAWFRCMRVC